MRPFQDLSNIAPPLAPTLPFAFPASPAAPLPRCTLLGGTFALLIQAGLAAGAVATLAYKRWRESPRRSWIVWSFDASKQAFAGLLQHVLNIALGVFFAVEGEASECSWYLLNFTISVVCGCFILWAVMKLYRRAVHRMQWQLLVSGEYGTPPSCKPWLAQ
ncbi:MAG: hypothetical protein SGPRY_014799, partial [Prymnesium sp.]